MARAHRLPLVVVNAPAGTGKTSFVAEWARAVEAPGELGWVTFDGPDSYSETWASVLGCLRGLGIEIPTPSGHYPTGELGLDRVLTLATAIAGSGRRLTIVLDNAGVPAGIAHEVDVLLRHTDGHLRLVLVGRTGPALPLYAYRLTDDLLEIRAADLAFTDDETAQLMNRLRAGLSDDAVHELNARCGGWVAGLKFAGRNLADRTMGFSVATVVTESRDIDDYLLGEVLNQHDPDVRRFLLGTCVPDVLEPGLAEELGGHAATRALRELTTSNTFLEPLPDRPGCYRYQPFFRDFLRARLTSESPRAAVELHRGAARWFLREGHADRAIAALAAIDAWDEVAVLMINELLLGRLLLEGRDGSLHGLVRHLPADGGDSSVRVIRAGIVLATGDTASCADELSAAQRTDRHPATRPDALRASAAVVDAVRAALAENAQAAARLASQAEHALGPIHSHSAGKGALRALARYVTGVALLRRGEFSRARTALTGVAESRAVRTHVVFRADCLGYLAIVDAVEGCLARAEETAAEALALTVGASASAGNGAATAHIAAALAALERYDLSTARHHVARAAAVPTLADAPVCRGLEQVVLAGLEHAGGHLHAALARLEAASAGVAETDPWLAGHLRVEAAKLSIADGQPEHALRQLGPLRHRGEPEVALATAAAYVEKGTDAAVGHSLAHALGDNPPVRARVEAMLVRAEQEFRQHSPDRARVALDGSLRLAAPEVLRRPFREAGPVVRRLLSSDPRVLLEHRWLGEAPNQDGRGAAHRNEPVRVGRAPADYGAVEPLTAREREVLDHLERLLTTEEIAEKMFVSVNTVRTHIRGILRKLRVNRRNAAVRKARELGLFG